MPAQTHTCLTLTCDVCRTPYEDPDQEYTVHFASLREAADATRADGWTVTADGLVYCDTRDEEHQAALDALMPPAPAIQTGGQLGLDGSEVSR